MHGRRWFRHSAITLVACFVLPAAGAAQRRLELTPFLAGHVPTSPLGSIRLQLIGSQPTTVEAEMKTAGGFGGRVGFWPSDRWGIEGTYFYAASDLRVTAGPFTTTIDAELQGGSVKAFLKATRGQTGTDLLVSAGVSGIQHGGDAFRLASEQFDIGGVIGSSLQVVMSPQVTFRIDGELYLYRWAAGPQFSATTQSDLMMTVGLGLRLAR